MDESDPESSVGELWHYAEHRLPVGWRMQSLRCGSIGLGERRDSDAWIAAASRPSGRPIFVRSGTARGAIDELLKTARQGS